MLAAVLAGLGTAGLAGSPLPAAEARFVLPGPGAEVYASGGDPTGLDRILADELAGVAPGLTYSPRLARAAEALAATVPDPTAAVPIPFVESLLHWAGAPHLSPRVTLLATSESSRVDLWDQVAARVRLERPGPSTEIGIGRVPGDGRPFRWRWAFVLAERWIELDPFPRRLALGAAEELRFRLEEGFGDPSVVVTFVDGSHSRRRAQPSGEGWRVTVQMGLDAGEQVVELFAVGRQGPRVVALFPVWVGREPPESWTGSEQPDESWIAEPWQAELLLLERVNDERHRVGLRPLVHDPVLAELARAHSRDMLERGYFAHVDPDGVDLAQRLRSAGLEVSRSAENIARSPTVSEAHASLMRSPGHAQNILAEVMDRVGVGVAMGSGPDGGPVVLVTQVFAALREPAVPRH